ncbi:MAG: radical SAM protein [Pseudomonadota bacterium]
MSSSFTLRVLLIQPPIRDFYRTKFREYPLGLLYLASSLKAAGFIVDILDARAEKTEKTASLPPQLEHLSNYYTRENKLFANFKHFGMRYNEIAEQVRRIAPDVVCISSMFTPYVGEVIKTAEVLRKAIPLLFIIAGGSHATADPSSLMGSGLFDCVIRGEGEKALPLLLSNIERYRGQVVSLKDDLPFVVDNLDDLPVPARELINPKHYVLGKKKYTMLITSRGCPHRCSFCSTHAVAGFAHRVRQIEHVLEEISECIDRFGINIFDLQDDNLLHEPERIKKLLDGALTSFEGIEFMATNGLNAKDLDRELLGLMKRAGFRKIDLALGTAGAGIRGKLKRPEGMEHYEQVLSWAEELKLPVTTYVILGLPFQKLREMHDTICFLQKKNTLIAPSIFYNVPGMPIFEEMKQYEYVSHHIARRSSAFNCFGDDFTRDDIFELFCKIREYNMREMPAT